jgi:hypothetical protein
MSFTLVIPVFPNLPEILNRYIGEVILFPTVLEPQELCYFVLVLFFEFKLPPCVAFLAPCLDGFTGQYWLMFFAGECEFFLSDTKVF